MVGDGCVGVSAMRVVSVIRAKIRVLQRTGAGGRAESARQVGPIRAEFYERREAEAQTKER